MSTVYSLYIFTDINFRRERKKTTRWLLRCVVCLSSLAWFFFFISILSLLSSHLYIQGNVGQEKREKKNLSMCICMCTHTSFVVMVGVRVCIECAKKKDPERYDKRIFIRFDDTELVIMITFYLSFLLYHIYIFFELSDDHESSFVLICPILWNYS